MRVLLLGSTGFIGTNIDAHLRQSQRFHLLTPSIEECNLLNYASLQQIVSKFKPDIIINAAFKGVNSKLPFTEEYFNENTHIVTNIMRAASEHQELKKLIHFGSGLEYGDSDKPIRENQVQAPKNTYATIKAMHTLLVRNLSESLKVPTIVLRPFNLYGEYDQKSVINYVITSVLHKKAFKITKGDQIRDYLYIGDFLNVLEEIITHIGKFPNAEIYNVASGQPIQLSCMFKTIFELLSFTYIQEYSPNPVTEYWHQVGDIRKIKKLITYPKLTELNVGLQRTIDWIKHVNA